MSDQDLTSNDLAKAIAWATLKLLDAGVASARPEVLAVLGHILGASTGEVAAKAIVGVTISNAELTEFTDAIGRRAKREPLQHILGVAYFRDLELFVGPGVFVPRPETETLVTLALGSIPEGGRVVDLGTGSGAIALSIASERADVTVFALEQNAPAFEWAQRNLNKLGLQNVTLAMANFLSPDDVVTVVSDAVDCIVSNPPYVPTTMPATEPEVRDWDPATALYAGTDGLADIRVISATAHRYLKPGGALFLEHAEHQGLEIRQLLAADGWTQPLTSPDLSGRDRYTSAKLVG